MPPRDVNEYKRKNAWNAQHYDSISIMLKKNSEGSEISDKDKLKMLAKEKGVSVSRYIIEAVNAYAGAGTLSPLDDESKKKR